MKFYNMTKNCEISANAGPARWNGILNKSHHRSTCKGRWKGTPRLVTTFCLFLWEEQEGSPGLSAACSGDVSIPNSRWGAEHPPLQVSDNLSEKEYTLPRNCMHNFKYIFHLGIFDDGVFRDHYFTYSS